MGVLAISGTTVLSPGLTSQLTARDTAGVVVVTGLTWQSDRPEVAAISPGGLVTAVGVGTAHVTATAAGATGRTSVVVEAQSGPTTTLDSCAVRAPGSYVLDSDLACLALSQVAAVGVNCAGHRVGPVTLSNVSDIGIGNCLIVGNVNVTNSNTVTITDSTLTSGFVHVSTGTNVQIVRDTITTPGVGGAAVVLDSGMNNGVRDVTLVGGYDDGSAKVGTDDGILIQNETGDVIEGNSISGFFDMGVEGVDAVTNVTIAGNRFSDVGVTAVGSYWCANWTGNVIRDNRVSVAPSVAQVGYQTSAAHCGTPYPDAAFSGNQFIGNVLRDQAKGIFQGPPRASMRIQMSGPVAGNLVQDNDFASYDGPNLVPLSGFIDGGGNICGPQNPAISNFPCTGGGLVGGRFHPGLLVRPTPPPQTMGAGGGQRRSRQ
jgi:Right handed beta helix region/Bacterial Ig-like domain